jgi:group II intron reverse transcriptase/maturase
MIGDNPVRFGRDSICFTSLLLGALSSGLLLLGSCFLYSLTGLTNFESLYIISSFYSITHNSILQLSLFILGIGLLLKIAAVPFHNWIIDVLDGVPIIVTTWIAVMPKISIIIFILNLQGLNSFNYWFSSTTLLFICALFSLIIGSIGSLTQRRIKRLLAYSSIVRRCAFHSSAFKTLVLSRYTNNNWVRLRGNPKAELSIPFKGRIRPRQYGRVVYRVVSSMVKAILLEDQSLRASSIGPQLVCNRLSGTLSDIVIEYRILDVTNWFRISILNVMSDRPKGELELCLRTSGSPKVGNRYGDGGFIVSPLVFCSYSNISLVRRIPGCNLRNYSKEASGGSTVKSNVPTAFLNLMDFAKKNPNSTIDRPVYRFMLNEKLYEIAYHKLRSNPGMMTPGINPTTLDGFSTEVIKGLIDKLKDESFSFSPGRRVMIPKASGRLRPLTVASPRDKLVQEVMRMILEAIFEPTFSDCSHGFRPGKSCHSALREVKTKFGVSTWFIEGDISKCFDSFDHTILMSIIEHKVADRRFTNLIRKALRAGYLDFKTVKHSIIGTPQGSIISPLLCNIYLNVLDRFVESLSFEFNKGKGPRTNPVWSKFIRMRNRADSTSDKRKIYNLMLNVPSKDPFDPSFRKLVYVRYADDWIIGVRGSLSECRVLLERIRSFLASELKLVLSKEKTLITNVTHGRALFLGVTIYRGSHQTFRKMGNRIRRNGRELRLEAPLARIRKKLTEAGFIKHEQPYPKTLWLHNSKDEIISLYNSVYRGFDNYYGFILNYGRIMSWIHSTLKCSCAKLLATKFGLQTQAKVFKKFGKDLKGSDKVGFIKPHYSIDAWRFRVSERLDIIKNFYTASISAASLNNLKCSICESKYRVEMHHIRALKDLKPNIRVSDAIMARKRRKQIPVCRACHLKIHEGKLGNYKDLAL